MEILKKLIVDYPQLSVCERQINAAFTALHETISIGGRLYVCGNGGSAADCQHIVGEMMKGFLKKRPVTLSPEIMQKLSDDTANFLSSKLQGAIPCHSLTTETALITALCNDVSADIMFAQQIFGYGKPDDCLICISTSGNATNVCLAAELASAMDIRTIAMTGQDGGKLAKLCHVSIQVPSDITMKIQEYHLPIYHALCAAIEEVFFVN